MKTDPGRLATLTTAVSVVVVLLLLAVLLYQRSQGHLPLGSPANVVLHTLTSGQKPLWGLANSLYGVYFLLLLPAIWVTYRAAKEDHPTEATLAFGAGFIALVTESLGRWWHAIVELPIVNAYQATDNPAAQRSLAELLARFDAYHQPLHLGGYAIVVWAVFMLILSLHRKSLPLWSGFLAFAMVPALGPFPPAGLLWAVPSVWFIGGGFKGSSERAGAGSRRKGGKAPALARSRR